MLGHSLLGGRRVGEFDTFCDVVLESLVGCLKKLLLVVVRLADDIDGLLNTTGL
jgi:hypothetical protein